jgi:transposase InsO family protein
MRWAVRELGLQARRKRRRKQTTRPGRGRWRAPDLIRRDFATEQLNRKWYGDGTEIATDEGKLYLDSVIAEHEFPASRRADDAANFDEPYVVCWLASTRRSKPRS